MTSSLFLTSGGSPFPYGARYRARSRMSADRGGRIRKIGRPRTRPQRTPRPLGYAFHVSVRQRANEKLSREPKRRIAEQAAQYASDNAIGIREAALRFETTVPLVDVAFRRLFPGVSVRYVTPTRLERAVEFMRTHDVTTRKAAAVFSVDPHELVVLWNRVTGSRRLLVGESAGRLSLTELAKAGNREAQYVERAERRAERRAA